MALSAASQLTLKLRLEAIFERDIKRVFSSIIQDFKLAVAVSGMSAEASRYNPAWSAALDTHYRRVQKSFSGVAVPGAKQQDEDNDELIALALLAWRDKTLAPHVENLTSTTRANISEALQQAGQQFAQDGKIPTTRELALAAAAILRRKFNGRIKSIAISETQAAAESTKYTEAEVEAGLRPRVLGGGQNVTRARKKWTTVGDSKVRPIHRAVNGQTVGMREPFTVNGELLMHPGDASLGASAANVANCRCVAQYIF